MPKFTNISNGPRGGYLKGKLVEVQPGAEAELDDAPEEWFAEADEDDGSLSSMKIGDLKKLAEEEGIDLGDATKKADIVSAIELAREEASQQE